VLHGPYALMVSGTAAPAAPDMTFLASLGLTGLVPAASRGWVAGAASGVMADAAVTVGWANSAAQYWATPQANGDFASPLMKPGSYTQTLYWGDRRRPWAATERVATHSQPDHRRRRRSDHDLCEFRLAQRASRGTSTWASGVPQPVSGSQPGPA
jgi:Polysaccharide lyase family 4, domain II